MCYVTKKTTDTIAMYIQRERITERQSVYRKLSPHVIDTLDQQCMYTAHAHSRFNAFLRFSAPEPPVAADRLAALLVVVVGTGPATLEFAVPSGDKCSLQSLLGIATAERDEGRVFAGED